MNTSKQQVLVTGLSGLIGTRFRQLYGDTYTMVNLDLTTGVDITNEAQVRNAFRESQAPVVIHLAAFTNVSGAHEQKDDVDGLCYKVNVNGAKTIAEVAQQEHKYLVHISTDYVFDGTKQTAYTEDDTPNPIEWYGQTKYLAEQAIIESTVPHVILRLAFPYQAQPMRPDFLAKTITALQNDTLPPAFTDHTITPTFADDVASVFDYCIKKRPEGIYHMTGSSSHSDFEIATMIKDVFKLPGTVRPGTLASYLEVIKRPYQKTMIISNQKLRTDFGIEMSTLQQGLLRIAKP